MTRSAPRWGFARRGEGALAHGDPYWPAQLAVLAALVLYLTLPEKLTIGPSWLIPALEGALLLGLVATTPRRYHGESPVTRGAAVGLVALVSGANLVSLVFLIHLLLAGTKATGHQLVLSAIQVWLTNVIVFGLWFWELDRGGPGRRSSAHAHESDAHTREPNAQTRPPNAQAREPDFLFPQMASPNTAPRGWTPGFVDYLYVAFTNAAAFSPTDTMPLSRWAKMLMLVEALASLLIVALVAGRAVNILG